MADKQIKEFTEETAPTGSDLLLLQRASDDGVRKMTLDELLAFMLESQWWEELGRTTLGVVGDTISVSSLTGKRYLRLLMAAFSNGGTLDSVLRFNNDSGNNYSWRFSANFAAASSSVSQSSIPVEQGTVASGQSVFAVVDIFNQLDREKLVYLRGTDAGSSGAANLPSTLELQAKWVNVAAQITRVDWLNLAGTGDFGTTSDLIVLGHD